MMAKHVVSTKLYLVVYVALLILMLSSVFLSTSGLGWVYVVLALATAACQAFLVIFFFMHIRWSTPLIATFAAAGFVWLAILIGLTVSDFATRAWLPAPRGW
jgi:cytochrome c oxidase subunit 4